MTAKRATAIYSNQLYNRIAIRIIPLLFLGYVVAFLDRVNIGFAKLQMTGDLGLSDAAYGLGAGVFFIGYFVFEVPSNLVMVRVGAGRWMARIMISWGLLSAAFMFVGDLRWGGMAQMLGVSDAEFSFHLLRFLLGAAEAGFFPGIILYLTYWFPRSRQAHMIALFMTAVGVASVVGAPLSGAILQYLDGHLAMRGWQWLFLIEGLPSVLVGFSYLLFLPDAPAKATWLDERERLILGKEIAAEEFAWAARGQLQTTASVFVSLRLWALCAAYMSGTIALYAVSFWMPTLIQQFGIAKNDYLLIGLLAMIPWGVMAVGQVLWARHSDRTGERRWHSFWGYAIAAAGFVLLAFRSLDEISGLIALTLITTGLGFSIVTFWPIAHRYLSGLAAAAGIALINSMGGLGGYIGPNLIGSFGIRMDGSVSAAFLLLAGIALGGGLILLAVSRDQAGRGKSLTAGAA